MSDNTALVNGVFERVASPVMKQQAHLRNKLESLQTAITALMVRQRVALDEVHDLSLLVALSVAVISFALVLVMLLIRKA